MCCWWETGSSTGFRGKNSRDPHMGDCDVLFVTQYQTSSPLGFPLSHLPLSCHEKRPPCLKEGQGKGQCPKFLLHSPLGPTQSAVGPTWPLDWHGCVFLGEGGYEDGVSAGHKQERERALFSKGFTRRLFNTTN